MTPPPPGNTPTPSVAVLRIITGKCGRGEKKNRAEELIKKGKVKERKMMEGRNSSQSRVCVCVCVKHPVFQQTEPEAESLCAHTHTHRM